MTEESKFFKTMPITINELLTEYEGLGDDSIGGGGANICKVCGDDGTVSNPTTVLEIPGLTDSVECSQLEFAGNNGMVPASQCVMVASLVAEGCGCI